jgi:cell division protein FtsZ
LLDVSVEGSKGCIFNVVGDSSLSLFEVNEAADVIRQAVDPEANVIFGVTVDDSMKDEVRLTLIATGFADHNTALDSRDKEITRLLRNIKTEKELEIPAFLRQRGLMGSTRRPEPVRPAAPASHSFQKRW